MLKKLTVIDKQSKPIKSASPPLSDWSPHLEMGENLQVRARTGFRAAVITLEPGLYLVSELSQEALDDQPQEIGFAFLPLLSAGMITAATQALKSPKKPLDLAKLPANLGRWLRKKKPADEASSDSKVPDDDTNDLPRWLQKLVSRKSSAENKGQTP